MEYLKTYENFQINESMWTDFLSFVKKGEEKIFTIFGPKYVKDVEEKVDLMTDEEKLSILDKIDKKIIKWRRSKGLITLVTVYSYITLVIGLLQDNDVATIVSSRSMAMFLICWSLSLFMQTRNEIIKNKVQEIFKKIK